MGPGQKFLTRVGSGQPFMVWVRISKIFPKNVKFFNFFPFRSKKIASDRKVPRSKPGQPLIYCGSKVSSGRVRAHLYLSQNIYQLYNFLCVFQNIYQLHNFCKIHVSLFGPGLLADKLDFINFFSNRQSKNLNVHHLPWDLTHTYTKVMAWVSLFVTGWVREFLKPSKFFFQFL